MNNTPQTLLDMHLPEFRRGYAQGRRIAHQKGESLTDKTLLDCLSGLLEDHARFNDDDAVIQYAVGQLIGQLSTTVIARAPDECEEAEREARLLAQLQTELGEEVAQSVKALWTVQDTLAERLSAQDYERVLSRDGRPVLKMVRSS